MLKISRIKKTCKGCKALVLDPPNHKCSLGYKLHRNWNDINTGKLPRPLTSTGVAENEQ